MIRRTLRKKAELFGGVFINFNPKNDHFEIGTAENFGTIKWHRIPIFLYDALSDFMRLKEGCEWCGGHLKDFYSGLSVMHTMRFDPRTPLICEKCYYNPVPGFIFPSMAFYELWRAQCELEVAKTHDC